MKVLGDTNLPMRWAEPASPMRPLAVSAFRELSNNGHNLVFFPQILVEFWASATRSVSSNGLGLSPSRVDQLLQRLVRFATIVPDVEEIYEEWRRLVVSHNVRGRQSHDARIAAAMRVHGITHILTFNVQDFTRYPGIVAVHPKDAASVP